MAEFLPTVAIIVMLMTVGGIWVAASNAEKAAREAAAIRKLLVAVLVPEFGKTTDLQRLADAAEALANMEADKRPPLS